MICSEGRWSCPVCRATEVRPAGTSTEHWQVWLRGQQELHGAEHARRPGNTPAR